MDPNWSVWVSGQVGEWCVSAERKEGDMSKPGVLVRFYEDGGHNCGDPELTESNRPGQDHLVPLERWQELLEDQPGEVLRSPWGKPEWPQASQMPS